MLRYPVATAASDSLLTRAGEQVTGHEFHRTRTTPGAGDSAAWTIDGETTGYASGHLHASYLHVHWAGHPQLAQRFADAVRARRPTSARQRRRLPRPSYEPGWPTRCATTATSRRARGSWTSPSTSSTGTGRRGSSVRCARASPPRRHTPTREPARAAIAQRHGRRLEEVLPTAGAAEAFTLVARLRPWRRPVVVHPQFTEPHAALEQAGHTVTTVTCRPEDGFALDPDAIPDDADLVVIGNPTNPTGVLHPAGRDPRLRRRGPARRGRRGVHGRRARRGRVPGPRASSGTWSSSGASPSTGRSRASAPATSSAIARTSAGWPTGRRRGRSRHRPSPRRSRAPAGPPTPEAQRARGHAGRTGAHASKPVSADAGIDHVAVGGALRPGPAGTGRARGAEGARHRRTPGRHVPRARRHLGPHRRPPPGDDRPAPHRARRGPPAPAHTLRSVMPYVSAPSDTAHDHAAKRACRAGHPARRTGPSRASWASGSRPARARYRPRPSTTSGWSSSPATTASPPTASPRSRPRSPGRWSAPSSPARRL